MLSALLMYLRVFLVGGTICMFGELIQIKTKITPARILVLFLMNNLQLFGAETGYLLFCFSQPLAWLFGLLTVLFDYRALMRKLKKQIAEQENPSER